MPRDLPDFTAMARFLFLEPGKCPHDDANMHGPRYGCPECMADDLCAAYIAGLRRAFAIAEKAGGGSESVQWALEAIHEAIAALEDDHAA